MGEKSLAKKSGKSHLPNAPWIFIHANTSAFCDVVAIAMELQDMIPDATYIEDASTWAPSMTHRTRIAANWGTDIEGGRKMAEANQEAAIAFGCNFVSVFVVESNKATAEKTSWRSNHLHIELPEAQKLGCAEKIFKWLFTVLTVPETLHLIPEVDMLAIDSNFLDYKYCAINKSCNHRKDAKIQFVALVVSKPQVGADQRLHWRVVDRTGEANFYFQYRGPESQSTWDWVMGLQPGDRKALPRMPMVRIKERKRITLIKAPVRGLAAIISGAGVAVAGMGKGLCLVSQKVGMGSKEKWIAEADIVHSHSKTDIKIFNEKGEIAWRDDASSVAAGSIMDEKVEKEFF